MDHKNTERPRPREWPNAQNFPEKQLYFATWFQMRKVRKKTPVKLHKICSSTLSGLNRLWWQITEKTENSLTFSLSYFYTFILSLFHNFILSLFTFSYFHFSHFHTLTLSHFHISVLSRFHTFTLLNFHTFTLSHSHTFTLSHFHIPVLSHFPWFCQQMTILSPKLSPRNENYLDFKWQKYWP